MDVFGLDELVFIISVGFFFFLLYWLFMEIRGYLKERKMRKQKEEDERFKYKISKIILGEENGKEKDGKYLRHN